MTELPLISVVTPSYNQGRFIEQTIRSVLDQSYPNVEYIVIDGASDDDSVQIIRRYEKRLSHWSSEPDDGQADAINKGWHQSRGQILTYLNADDFYHPGALERVARAFNESPEVGIVGGCADWVSESGEYLRSGPFDPSGYFKRPLNMADAAIPQPSVFFRREVLEQVGPLDASLHLGLDREFFLRALGNFDHIAVDQRLSCMRIHESAKSTRSASRFADDILDIARRLATRPEDYPRFVIAADQTYGSAHLLSARFSYFGGAYRDALKHLARAVRFGPALGWTVVTRELPRLLLRALLGVDRYVALGASIRRGPPSTGDADSEGLAGQ